MPSDNNPPQGFPVKKGFMMSFTKPTTGNSPITFKVLDPASNQLMKINGKDDIVLTPSLTKGAPTTCEILAPGMSQGLYFLVDLTLVYLPVLSVLAATGQEKVCWSADFWRF